MYIKHMTQEIDRAHGRWKKKKEEEDQVQQTGINSLPSDQVFHQPKNIQNQIIKRMPEIEYPKYVFT